MNAPDLDARPEAQREFFLLQIRSDDGERGDGGGFGAENARMAISSEGISDCAVAIASSRAWRSVVVRSCSASTIYVEPIGRRVAAEAARTRSARGAGS